MRIVQHGGDWDGQHSGFFFIPERDFAFTVLTNSNAGDRLVASLCADDWLPSRFAGLHNLPASPRSLTGGELAQYEGDYTANSIAANGETSPLTTRLTA